jgi:hypothetical protein
LALYEELTNQDPTPFKWKFDRHKLAALLTKIEAHEKFLAPANACTLTDYEGAA